MAIKEEGRGPSPPPPQLSEESPCSAPELRTKRFFRNSSGCCKTLETFHPSEDYAVRSFITSSTMKVPMRPIMQALEFQISAVWVNPKKGSLSFGCTLGTSTWTQQELLNRYLGTSNLPWTILLQQLPEPFLDSFFTHPWRKLCSIHSHPHGSWRRQAWSEILGELVAVEGLANHAGWGRKSTPCCHCWDCSFGFLFLLFLLEESGP